MNSLEVKITRTEIAKDRVNPRGTRKRNQNLPDVPN